MAIFGTILSALNIASSLKGNNRRNTINAAVTNARNNNFSSIAAKASEGILQFPVIISDSISYEAAVMTAKALERSYAAFLLTIFSMNSVTNDLSNDGTITNYLRSLHDNSLNATMDSDDAGDDVSGNQIIDAFRQATRESTTLTGEVKDPENDNIVYNFHFYEPFLFTHQLASWQPLLADRAIRYSENIESYRKVSKEICCFGSGLYNTDRMGAEFMEKLISEAVEAAENANVPLYCGEYGVIDMADISDTALWFEDIHSVFEKYGIGRAAWTYKSMNFGISGEHYSPFLNRIIQCL